LAADGAEARTAALAHAAHYAAVVARYDAAIDAGTMTYDRPHEWEQVARAVAWLAPQVARDGEAAEGMLRFARHWRNVLLNHYDPRRVAWAELAVRAAVTAESA